MEFSGFMQPGEETKRPDSAPVMWDEKLEGVLEKWRLRAWASQIPSTRSRSAFANTTATWGFPS